MKTIIVMNNKGGVGKTTTSDQIAVGFAKGGKKTLLVDLDPQANTTDMFGKQKNLKLEDFLREKLAVEDYTLGQFAKDFDRVESLPIDVSHVLLDANLIHQGILKTKYEHLDLLPSSIKLANADTKIREDNYNPQQNHLKDALDLVANKYDYCVIDCPPILNVLTVNALCACNEVIIPIKVDVGAIKGFLVTLENIQKVVKGFKLKIKVNILFTMVNRNNVDKLLIELFKKICKNQVFETTIRNQAKAITQAGFEQEFVIEDKNANVGADYQQLINEMMEKTAPEKHRYFNV